MSERCVFPLASGRKLSINILSSFLSLRWWVRVGTEERDWGRDDGADVGLGGGAAAQDMTIPSGSHVLPSSANAKICAI